MTTPGSPSPSLVTGPERLRSEAWLRFFQQVLARRLRQSFHAVRLARPGAPAVSDALPLIVYCNHPSWWDAALVPVLLATVFPNRRIYGPIDAEALRRYGFMRRLGFFGVQQGTYAGAATFLRVGRQLLAQPGTLFCVTPQGSFVDPRVRPLRLQPGLAGLISVGPRATVLPLAIEYPFWGERTPEALVRFGEPRVMGNPLGNPTGTPLGNPTGNPRGGSQSGSLADIRRSLDDGLTTALDRLADDAISRDPGRFLTVQDGSVGVGGTYQLWQRLRAWQQGDRFQPAHLRQDRR